jgi:hypothetical protein
MTPRSLWNAFTTSIRKSFPKWLPLARVAFLPACIILAVFSAPAFAAGPVLHVLVSYGPAADSYPSAYNGRFIQLQPDQSGYGGKTVATVSAAVLVLLDHVDAGAARQPSALIAELKGDIAARANLIAASMVAQMRGQNSPTGVMEFKQDVLLPNNQKGVLAWRMMVDSSGAMRYGDPEVLPEEALTLDVVYTPLSLSAALPATWPRYADAGLLKWRLIDKTGTARTAWTSVDAAGAFDNPESTGGGAVDPDAGLKCLILDRTQCGGPIDIKTLMDQQGAAAAYVAYTRRLAPVYDDVPDPAHQGEFLRKARISLSVDNRELTYNGCGQNLTYRNQGAYGFTLAARSEKYLVDANLRYYPVDWADETRISPTEPYDKSVSVARADIASIGSMIITPGGAGNELVNSVEVSGIVYLAPVVQNGQDGYLTAWKQSDGLLFTTHHKDTSFGNHVVTMLTCEEDRGVMRFTITGNALFRSGSGEWVMPARLPTADDPVGVLQVYPAVTFAEFTPGTPAVARFRGVFGQGDMGGMLLLGTATYDGDRTITVGDLTWQSTMWKNNGIEYDLDYSAQHNIIQMPTVDLTKHVFGIDMVISTANPCGLFANSGLNCSIAQRPGCNAGEQMISVESEDIFGRPVQNQSCVGFGDSHPPQLQEFYSITAQPVTW